MGQTARAATMRGTKPLRSKPMGTRPGPGPAGQAILLLGALATAGLATGALASFGTGSQAAELAVVPADELEAATPSLYAAEAIGRIADARSCKMPLAMLALSKAAASTPGDTIRIRSGTYLSPAFTLTPTAQRVAIPYPAPYATGHGELVILGEGSGYAVGLTPVQQVPTLSGRQTLKVHWQPRAPC